jgi:RNA polymerase sigma-70 factor (ECF subfamily)
MNAQSIQRRPNDASQATDGALVARALAGHSSAFDALTVRYQSRAVAIAYRLLRNVHDAMEISQEAFLRAFTNLRRLKNIDAFGAWLLRIVSNLSLNLRRSRKTVEALPFDEALCGPARRLDPLLKIQGEEFSAQLLQALAQLPYRQRAAILLFAFEEMPQKQIAKTLGCSVEAVKWHVFRGRRKLMELLGSSD